MTGHPVITFLPPRQSSARCFTLLLFVLTPIGTGLLGLALGQDANWDLRNYHWYNAHALLNGRLGLDLLPAQLPSFYNPALDVPYYLLASHVPARLAGFLLSMVQGLNFMLLFLLAHAALPITGPLRKTILCALLGLLGLLGGGGIAQIGTTFYDNITSLGILLSLLLVLRFMPQLFHASCRNGFLFAFLCGLPTGAMTGLKLPAVVFSVGLCGGMLFLPGSPLRRLWITFAFGLGVLLGMAMTYGPWAWHLHTHFGNPLFPYFNNLFQSPLTLPASTRDIQFLPQTLWDNLLFPARFAANPFLVGEIFWSDLRLPLLYFLLPACVVAHFLFTRKDQDVSHPVNFPATRYLLAAAALTYLAWLLLFSIYRYIIALEMLAPLLLVLALGLLPLRMPLKTALTAATLLLVALSIRPGTWGRAPAWLENAVSVEYPQLTAPQHLMILMAGFEPYSHVISEFPAEIPFIRIQSNFANPDENKGINGLIRERVTAHQGTYKLLIPEYQLHFAQDALQFFNLRAQRQSCQPVIDHLYDNHLVLCDIQRTDSFAVTP